MRNPIDSDGLMRVSQRCEGMLLTVATTEATTRCEQQTLSPDREKESEGSESKVKEVNQYGREEEGC